jgi:hypothetical protein
MDTVFVLLINQVRHHDGSCMVFDSLAKAEETAASIVGERLVWVQAGHYRHCEWGGVHLTIVESKVR